MENYWFTISKLIILFYKKIPLTPSAATKTWINGAEVVKHNGRWRRKPLGTLAPHATHSHLPLLWNIGFWLIGSHSGGGERLLELFCGQQRSILFKLPELHWTLKPQWRVKWMPHMGPLSFDWIQTPLSLSERLQVFISSSSFTTRPTVEASANVGEYPEILLKVVHSFSSLSRV